MMSSKDHIINVFLYDIAWPDYNFFTSVNCVTDPSCNFSITGFVIKYPATIANPLPKSGEFMGLSYNEVVQKIIDASIA